ncbi:MAG: hypothetical protein R2724_32130 [Bryobacterales bacterium]
MWKVSDKGGTATRLTAHPGLELFPKFSPDGKWIAFTGQYDGDEQVYVMPSSGGVPKQLTYYPARGPLPDRWGFDHQVYGWSPDSQRVLFRSTREYWSPAQGRLYTVSIEGGLPVALPMPVSGAGDFGPGRQERGLLASVSRLPHLEALPRRLGAGPVHLLPRHQRDAPRDR